MSNREISRLFNLYAELLLLHQKDERFSALLSGAAYRLRNISEDVIKLNKQELSNLFRTQVISVIEELQNTQTIEALDELIQLTPQGLFEMMPVTDEVRALILERASSREIRKVAIAQGMKARAVVSRSLVMDMLVSPPSLVSP